MRIETFDDFMSTETSEAGFDGIPFPFREDKSDKGTHNWLVENFRHKKSASLSRMMTYKRYVSYFKGIQWRSTDPRDFNRDTSDYGRRRPKMVTNFISDMVTNKVAHRAKFKAGVTLIPQNNEQCDINNAEGYKLLLDSRADEIGLDSIMSKGDLVLFLTGHVFFHIPWNPDAGVMHPLYAKLRNKYKGNIPDKVLKQLRTSHSIKVGDVDVIPMGPDKVFPQLGKACWEEVEDIDHIEWRSISELKAEYPEVADKIQETIDEDSDFFIGDSSRKIGQTLVKYYCHKPTKHLPNGFYAVYTDDALLESGPFQYSDGELPYVPDTDIDVYGELWGRSFIHKIEQMQRFHNTIQSSFARDFSVLNAPKIAYPKGSVKKSAFANEIGLMEFTGAQPPIPIQFNRLNSGAIELQDRLEKKISQFSTIYDISRGEVPMGVTANSALRFLDEQEGQKDFIGIDKRKERIRKVYKMMMNRMSQYYKPKDGRTVRILGRDNEYMIEDMMKMDYTKTYDVKLKNAPMLPDTKTGKISSIIDLNAATQKDPIFRKEEIVQMLDLGLYDAYKSQATVAVTAAKTVVDKLLRKKTAPEPQLSDNLLIYYDTFIRAMQTNHFREIVDETTKKAVIQYVTVLEGLMFEKSKRNKKFLFQLMESEHFPIFFNMPPGITLDSVAQNFTPPQAETQGMKTEAIKNIPSQLSEDQGE